MVSPFLLSAKVIHNARVLYNSVLSYSEIGLLSLSHMIIEIMDAYFTISLLIGITTA